MVSGCVTPRSPHPMVKAGERGSERGLIDPPNGSMQRVNASSLLGLGLLVGPAFIESQDVARMFAQFERGLAVNE